MNELKIFENPSSEKALAYFTELNSDSYPEGVVYILEWGAFCKNRMYHQNQRTNGSVTKNS